MSDFLQRLKSRKFLLALGLAILVFANSMFDLGLTNEEMQNMVAVVIAYIAAEGAADTVERLK